MSDQKEQHVDGVIKQALLEAMDEFHRVCEENDLKYYLIGGSLIGAIRHKGCIPWDDDIDVIMPKRDFNKLLKLRRKFSPKFSLSHRTFPDSLLLPIARVENKSVVIDEGYYSGVYTGVFIDVFCFNYTFATKALQKLHFGIVGFFRNLLILKDKTYSREKYSTQFLKILSYISLFFLFIPRFILNKMLTASENIGVVGCKRYIANLHGVWKTKEIVLEKLFKTRKLYDFEGRQYWSIEDADAWLKPIYGDYMQLPPVEQRKPKHITKIISIDGVKANL